MPTKSKKSKSKKSKAAEKTGSPKSAKKKSSGVRSRQAAQEVDCLSPAARENLYYIAHNAMDCLRFRGFGWAKANTKKKKGTKKKAKK